MKNSDNYRKFNEKFLTEVTRQAAIIHPKTVLVVGAGEGILSNQLKKAGIGQKTIEVDISGKTNATKKEKSLADNRKADIYSLPFKVNTFDLVICCDVLQKLENPKKALSELQRVAHRYVILAVPNAPMLQLASFMRGENLLQLGKNKKSVSNWTGEGFEAFAESKFAIFTNKRPFPWTVLVGEKL